MSSTRPARVRAAQAKIAAQRAAQTRHRRRMMLASGSIAAVVALFATLLIVKAATGAPHSGAAGTVSAAPSAVTTQVAASVAHVPASVLDTVGRGNVANPPTRITGADALTSGGKPQVVYLGYEWCPYCAAQRWALVVALGRFGTFTGLGLTQSAGDDVYPSTHTFTFAHAAYTSAYLSFSATEMQDANRNPLQTPTAAEQHLIDVYDQPPYTSSSGGLPFLDLGGRYVVSGASYNPQTLAGQDWTQIADALANPSSADAQAVDGSANALTAALCTLTGNQPAAVCSSIAVTAAKGTLK